MELTIYRKGQGKYTRLYTAFGVAAIVAIGSYQLYELLESLNWEDQKVRLVVSTAVPVGVFVMLTGLVFWLVNKHSVADFMIAAEGEMKKVSWSSRQEIMVSTFVVIMVVTILAVFLGVVDFAFSYVFSEKLGI